jgi:hypothetical protein
MIKVARSLDGHDQGGAEPRREASRPSASSFSGALRAFLVPFRGADMIKVARRLGERLLDLLGVESRGAPTAPSRDSAVRA